MTAFVIITLVVAIGVASLWFFARKEARRSVKQDQIDHQKIDAMKAEFKLQADQFEQGLPETWTVRHVREGGWAQRDYLMMSEDQRQLGFARTRYRGEFIVEWSDPLDVASIVSVELQQDSTTIMKLETAATSKKTGSLGRAAVGGVLFGGAGAIVGAVSASSKVEATTTSTSKTVKGPLYLVIGTTDLVRPVIKTEMKSKHEGEQWLHRIRGALALIAQA